MKQNKSPWKVHPLKCVPRGWLALQKLFYWQKILEREREREVFSFFCGGAVTI